MSLWYHSRTFDRVISSAMISCKLCTEYVCCVYAIIRVIEQTYPAQNQMKAGQHCKTHLLFNLLHAITLKQIKTIIWR